MGVGKIMAERRTRHHMLYPRKVWLRAGKEAFEIRCAFTVMLPQHLHMVLHDEIDKELGENLSEADLPDESTFKRVLENYKSKEKSIKQYSSVNKLKWLRSQFNLSQAEEECLLDKLIRLEIGFLEEHKDEL